MRRAIISLMLACFALSGCGDLRGERVVSGVGSDNETITSAPLRPSSTSDAIEVRNVVGNEAFSFSATELGSRRAVRGSELVSDGPVVMSFLVPQCPVCSVAGPDLAASAAQNPDITYVFVHSGGSPDAYEAYIERTGLDRTALDNIVHIDDSSGLLWARFGVIQQPTNVLIGADGSVTQALGALSLDELEDVTIGLTAS